MLEHINHQKFKQFALIVTKEKLLPKDLLFVKYVLPANMFQQKVAVLVLNVHKVGNVQKMKIQTYAFNAKLVKRPHEMALQRVPIVTSVFLVVLKDFVWNVLTGNLQKIKDYQSAVIA